VGLGVEFDERLATGLALASLGLGAAASGGRPATERRHLKFASFQV
jgi:hypothetical protein